MASDKDLPREVCMLHEQRAGRKPVSPNAHVRPGPDLHQDLDGARLLIERQLLELPGIQHTDTLISADEDGSAAGMKNSLRSLGSRPWPWLSRTTAR